MGRSLCLAAIALAWLGWFTLDCAAQGQPGPFGGPKSGGPGPGAPGPGGTPGFGMFGGPMPGFGFFGGGPGFGRTSVAAQYERLLNIPSVQKELHLSDDQKARIREIGEKNRSAVRDLFSSMRDVREEDRKAKAEEMGKKMQVQGEETRKAIEAVLELAQRERLRGIAVQVLGIQALFDKEVQQDLKLEEFQIAAMRVIDDRAARKTRELFTPGGDPQAIGQRSQEIRAETEKRILGLLNDQQKAAFERLKGAKFEIPESEMRNPRLFGGRGGRREGGDRGQSGSPR